MVARVLLRGERVGHACANDLYMFIYEVGGGWTWELDGASFVDPGWTLDEARNELGGEVGSLLDAHGCAYRFSLAPWWDAHPNGWRVLAVEAIGGGVPRAFTQWQDLSEIAARSQGGRVTVTDPGGRGHTVSLRPWSDLAPDTLLHFGFSQRDDRKWRWWPRIVMRVLYDAMENDREEGTLTARGWNPNSQRELHRPTLTRLRFTMGSATGREDAGNN